MLFPSIAFLFYFLPLFFLAMHHELCGFAISVVERHAPDIVILAPAERQMFCFGK